MLELCPDCSPLLSPKAPGLASGVASREQGQTAGWSCRVVLCRLPPIRRTCAELGKGDREKGLTVLMLKGQRAGRA